MIQCRTGVGLKLFYVGQNSMYKAEWWLDLYLKESFVILTGNWEAFGGFRHIQICVYIYGMGKAHIPCPIPNLLAHKIHVFHIGWLLSNT